MSNSITSTGTSKCTPRSNSLALLSFSADNDALNGDYLDLHKYNLAHAENYSEKLFSFARWSTDSKLVVLTSFERKKSTQVKLQLPKELIQKWKLQNGTYRLENIFGKLKSELVVKNGSGTIRTSLAPMESQVFLFEHGADH